jgi:hypothetical protein
VLLALATVVATAGPAAAAVKKCPKGKLARVVNGKRTCVAAKAFRQRVTRATPSALALTRVVGDWPVKLRQTNGRVVTDTLPPKLGREVTAAYPALEAELTAAALAALGQSTNARARASADGPPTVSHNGDGSVSASISKTFTADGKSLTVDVGLAARPHPDRETSLEIDVGLTFDDGNGTTTSRGFRIADIGSKPRQECPTAKGAIQVDNRFGGTTRSSEKFGSSRVKLGTVNEATTVNETGTARAQMGPDGRLQPFTVNISTSLDYARSAAVLAFFGSRQRIVATGTMTGTMDPNTGILSGAAISTNSRNSGYTGSKAALDAEMRKVTEKMLNDQAGAILKSLKQTEAKARSGGCTHLVFNPGSPSPLKPRASKNVAVHLETNDGNTTVGTVRWAAVAAKGSVSPTTSKVAKPTLKVKGAATGPRTAQINVKAVSPAGISTGRWIGTADHFPASYSGTASLTTNLVTISEAWQGTFTFTRSSETANPDGSSQALYSLTSASLQSHTATALVTVPASCSWSTSDSSPTIKAGDVELQVSRGGAWTGAFLVDVQLHPTTETCVVPGPPTTIVTSQVAPKSFLNSRGPGSALRPMSPGGVIAATSVTDLSVAGFAPVASWSLSPAG